MKRDDSGFLIDSVVETRPFSRAKFNQSFRCKPAAVADRKAHRRSDSSRVERLDAADAYVGSVGRSLLKYTFPTCVCCVSCRVLNYSLVIPPSSALAFS